MTGGDKGPPNKSTPRIPPQWILWRELPCWIAEVYGQEWGTGHLLREVVLELRREPDCFMVPRFRLWFGDDLREDAIISWDGLIADWETGQVKVQVFPLLARGGLGALEIARRLGVRIHVLTGLPAAQYGSA